MKAKRYQAENALLRAHPSGDHAEASEKAQPGVATLPLCPNDMGLMIEAKDEEQAVFELMRTFELPGFKKFNDIIPYVRNDDNNPVKAVAKKTPKKKGKKAKTG